MALRENHLRQVTYCLLRQVLCIALKSFQIIFQRGFSSMALKAVKMHNKHRHCATFGRRTRHCVARLCGGR